ncbi:MAG: tRNA 2-thiouridine(34) synthase MnmA [Oscillospiraceae bacterium]
MTAKPVAAVTKVLAAMSGGVDSSAACKVLLDAGYEVAGATMRLYANEDIMLEKSRTCCSLNDVEDARYAAFRLGIDFHVFNFAPEFKEHVIERFVKTYERGATPNPCVDCNRQLKFGKFLERARLLGFDAIATGHYAVREFNEATGRWRLRRSPDRAKDQSYVLYAMTQEQLSRTMFPVGMLEKSRTREIAAASNLVTADKPDSQDICFIPDGDYADFILRYTGEAPESGVVRLTNGTAVGTHRGLLCYTIGQRRGLGISYSEPLYVVDKDAAANTLIVGRESELYTTELVAEDVNFIDFDALTQPVRVTAQTRYHQQDTPAILYPAENGCVRVVFDQPKRAVTAGQAVVFYDGDYVVGGGTIADRHS